MQYILHQSHAKNLKTILRFIYIFEFVLHFHYPVKCETDHLETIKFKYTFKSIFFYFLSAKTYFCIK